MLSKRDALDRHNQLRGLTTEALHRLATLSERRGARVTVDGVETPRSQLLRDTAERLRNDRFTLAVVGEFSRGKSTLINALLGQAELLPTAIEPATAAVTILTYGYPPSAEVHYEDGAVIPNVPLEDLAEYVVGKNLDGKSFRQRLTQRVARFTGVRKLDDFTLEDVEHEVEQETQELKPTSEVASVHVRYPADFLTDSIRLVDTPGIGSVNPKHGEATRRFVREADAIVFLINTDPVISASECNFLTFLQDHIDHFLFVVTKIDRFSDSERERSVHYTKDTIVEFAGVANPRIFPMSATTALQAQAEGDAEKLAASGFTAFVNSLDQFLIEGRGHRIVKEYVAATRSHLRELQQAASVELQGIELDLEEIRARVEQSAPALEKAKSTQQRLMRLLEGELGSANELVMGAGGTDWIRLSTSIQEEVFAQIDQCDWQQMEQAAEIIPIFVREIMTEEMRQQTGRIAEHLADLRDWTIKECQQAIKDLNTNIAFDFDWFGEVAEDEFAFELDPALFRVNLTQVSTLTIGSTIALALATGLMFGGIGALVTLGGGLLAGTRVTSALRLRARERMKQELEEPLGKLIDNILDGLTREVSDNLGKFRRNVQHLLERTIGSVEESISRLQQERESAEFSAPQRKQELAAEQRELADVEAMIQRAQLFAV